MSKKMTMWVLVMVVLASAAVLFARERGVAGGRGAARGQRGGMAGQGMRPGQDRYATMRAATDTWLKEMDNAFRKNDRNRMRQLLEQMKQVQHGFKRGMGRGGPGMGRSGEGMEDMGRGGPGMGRGSGGMEHMGRGGSGMGLGGGQGDYSFVPTSALAKTETEKKILAVLDNMNKNQRRGTMNISPEDGRLLRLLTETVGAKHVVEVGTSNGYSGIWFCLALRKTGGKLTTHEVDKRQAALARDNFKRADVDTLVTLVEGDAHENVTRIKTQMIDVLFLDASKKRFVDHLDKLLPLVRPGGLIITHNMNLWQPDAKFIKTITMNPALETLLLHKDGSGVGVTMKKR